MKILILDHYYDAYLNDFYTSHPEHTKLDFHHHRQLMMAMRYGISDTFSYHLKKNGCVAEEIITNDVILQTKWAKENGIPIFSLPVKLTKATNHFFGIDWRFKIVCRQIQVFKPDVILIQERNIFNDQMVSAFKQSARFIVSMIASPIPNSRNFRSVDLIVTCLPYFVPLFRSKGISAEYLPLGFDSRILKEIGAEETSKFNLTFVGGISKAHQTRIDLLESICSQMPIDWFGYGKNALNFQSPLRKKYQGEVCGLKMYQILRQSCLTLNCHIDMASNYAVNMRLYEATGMQTCLVTDWKPNLSDFFDPEREVVTYRSTSELEEKLKYLIGHEQKAKEIGCLGQARTLRDHTYDKRVSQFLHILKHYLKN